MDNISLYAAITKTDDDQRLVEGYASTEALDSQGEIVQKEAIIAAVDDYMKFANIREMHQPSAVGKTKSAVVDDKGMYITVKVVDDNAWKKVKEGVYNGFSIGGRVKTQKGSIISALSLSEISLVDRPANPECRFEVFKMDMEPTPEVKPTEPVVEAPVVPVTEPVPTVPVVEPIKEATVTPTLKKFKIQKSMYDVAELARVIACLSGIEEGVEWEGQFEGNDPDDAAYAAAIMEHIKALGSLLQTRVASEVNEMVTEEKTETKVIEYAEKTEMEKIDADIKAGKMPTDTQIRAMIKAMDMEPTSENIGIVTMEVAGKILNNIKKAQTEGPTPAQTTLADTIKKLSQTVDEIEKQNVDKKEDPAPVPVVPSTPEITKSDDLSSSDLAKVAGEISALKELVAKLADQPLAIKARSSYSVVEKGMGVEDGSAKEELSKAEARSDELAAKIQKGAITKQEREEADELGIKVMQLRRIVK